MGSSGLNLFISYRRSETSGYSGRIYDRLRAALPDADVFIDVERIDAGQNWRERLAERIRAADAVLVLIGDEWRSLTDTSGRRRLDDPEDVTRWELESALAHGRRIVPVLLDAAAPLQAQELPEALAPIAALQAVRIRHEAFDAGLEDLIARLTGRRLRDEAETARGRLRIERAKRWAIPALALLAVLLAWTRLFDLLTLDTRIATWTLAVADAVSPLPLAEELMLIGIGPEHDARDPAMRTRYGAAVATLARAGARRIVLDIHFHEPRPADAQLAGAMREARKLGAEVFFSFIAMNGAKPRAVPELAAAASGLGLACLGRRLGYAQSMAAAIDIRRDGDAWRASPLPSLAILGAFGAARIAGIDPGENRLAVEAAGKQTRVAYSVLSNEVAGTQGCPAMRTGTRTAEVLVRVSPPELLRSRRVTLTELLAGGVAAGRIAGKTVVVGFETPAESFRLAHGLERTSAFGYELHANAINVLASGRTPTFAPPGVQAALAGIFATFGAAFGVRFRSLGSARTAALAAALALLYLAAAVAVVAAEDVVLNSAYDISAFLFAFALFRHLSRRWLR